MKNCIDYFPSRLSFVLVSLPQALAMKCETWKAKESETFNQKMHFLPEQKIFIHIKVKN